MDSRRGQIFLLEKLLGAPQLKRTAFRMVDQLTRQEVNKSHRARQLFSHFSTTMREENRDCSIWALVLAIHQVRWFYVFCHYSFLIHLSMFLLQSVAWVDAAEFTPTILSVSASRVWEWLKDRWGLFAVTAHRGFYNCLIKLLTKRYHSWYPYL